MSLPSSQSRERHNRRAIAIGSGGNVRAALADGRAAHLAMRHAAASRKPLAVTTAATPDVVDLWA